MRDCLLSVAIPQPISVMCSLQMLIIATGVACLYAHLEAELRDRRASRVESSAPAWCRAPPGLTNAQVALAEACTVPVQRSSSGSIVPACLLAIYNMTAKA